MVEIPSFGNIKKVLENLGVSDLTLPGDQKKTLDEQGYVVFPNAMDTNTVQKIQLIFEETANLEDQPASASGTRGVKGLADSAFILLKVCSHPVVLAAVHHILNRDFGLHQMGGRDPQPGFGQQGLHTDWLPRTKGERYHVVTTIWMLDDFTSHNGATRIVPGTHHLTGPVPKNYADPASYHPQEIQAIAGSGSVLLMNGHLWHSGMRNNSRSSRRALQCIFAAREHVKGRDSQAAPAELSEAMAHVAGFQNE